MIPKNNMKFKFQCAQIKEPGSCVYALPTAAFMLEQQTRVAATETTWPVELRIFTVWLPTNQGANPAVHK